MRSSARAAILGLLAAAWTAPPAFAAEPASAIAYGAYEDTGLSSWYGDELSGNRTASGERFDPAAMTAAHRTLPLGSFAEVTCVETGRSIIVRINDRGPGRRDRLIDLSRGAARSLGTDRRSVAHVRIRSIIQPSGDTMMMTAGLPRTDAVTRVASVDAVAPLAPLPRLIPGRAYSVQIATFSNADRAQALAKAVDGRTVAGGGFWRVRLGPFKTANALQRARDAVAARGYGDAKILPED